MLASLQTAITAILMSDHNALQSWEEKGLTWNTADLWKHYAHHQVFTACRGLCLATHAKEYVCALHCLLVAELVPADMNYFQSHLNGFATKSHPFFKDVLEQIFC